MKNIQGLDSIRNLLPCTTARASSLRTDYVITYLVLCLLDEQGHTFILWCMNTQKTIVSTCMQGETAHHWPFTATLIFHKAGSQGGKKGSKSFPGSLTISQDT